THLYKSVCSIEVISINHTERTIYQVFCTQHRMRSTPRLLTFNDAIHTKFGEVEILKSIINFDLATKFIIKLFTHHRFEFFTNNKYNLTEACPNRIINGVVDDRFTMWAKAIHLFQ